MTDPDRSGWSLKAVPVPNGMRLELGLPDLGGAPATAAIRLSRAEARAFARDVLAAAGDAAERTYPHPPIETADG